MYFQTQKILLTECTTYFAHLFDTVEDDIIETMIVPIIQQGNGTVVTQQKITDVNNSN